MLEIRGHARGGQGMVTAFEILAKTFSKLGDYQVQSFPAFGVERTGAPIQAFLRVAKKNILNRSNVYSPHLIVVFDETLIDMVPVFDGLRDNGAVILNTERSIENFKDKAENIFTIPATNISLEKGLGSKSLPIVNAAMIGAIMRVLEGDIDIVQKVVSDNVPTKPEKNAEASLVAFNSVIGNETQNKYLLESLTSDSTEHSQVDISKLFDPSQKTNLDRSPYWSQPMSLNKTGNWRVLTPQYVTKNAPCSDNCPAGTNVREFIRLAGDKKYEMAVNVIYEHNPFPGICGRVCPHFCEQNCNRNEIDEGLNIGAVERFLGDKFNEREIKKVPVTQNEKIAVIGSGPAGLTAALRLREKGYDTTVFEALPYAGGMMRTGIPEFRLPKETLDREIQNIIDAGVELVLNKKVSVKDLQNDFDGVVVSVGSHIGTKMKIENEEMVLEGIEFLHNFKMNGEKYGIEKGDKIAVIGGGNTAIDVARTVLRLGAKPTIYYRRTHKEMPAIAHEVDEARAEGVEIEFLTAPAAINNADGKIEVTMIKMELGEPDESGRRRPVPIEGSETAVSVHKVITAIGQKFDDFAFSGKQVKPEQGKIEFEANIPVFCSGDMAWGGTVTEAIGSGNKVAEEIHAHFRDLPYSHETHHGQIALPEDLNFAYYLPTPRKDSPMKHETDFFNNFEEVVSGLNEEDIVTETSRCLHCGECFSCGNCYNYCPDAAIHIDDTGRLRIDYEYCKGCGICANECPSSAINFSLKEVSYE